MSGNCFFKSLKQAFRPLDFYVHFPDHTRCNAPSSSSSSSALCTTADPSSSSSSSLSSPTYPHGLPAKLFDPYFQSLPALASLLVQLVGFMVAMYGYSQVNDGVTEPEHKGLSMFFVSSHVLVNNVRTDDRELGEFMHAVQTKEYDLEGMLQKGYYDGGGSFDPVLVLLCEFTGLEIHVTMDAFTIPIRKKDDPAPRHQTFPEKVFVYSRLNTLKQSKVYLRFQKGHVQFVRRQDLPDRARKRKLVLH